VKFESRAYLPLDFEKRLRLRTSYKLKVKPNRGLYWSYRSGLRYHFAFLFTFELLKIILFKISIFSDYLQSSNKHVPVGFLFVLSGKSCLLSAPCNVVLSVSPSAYPAGRTTISPRRKRTRPAGRDPIDTFVE